MALTLYFPDRTKTLYQLIPSLEDLVAIKLVIILWNRNDVRNLLNKMRLLTMCVYVTSNVSLNIKTQMETIEHEVKCCIEQFWLPDNLMKKVMSFIKPIGYELLNWKEYHERLLHEPHMSDMLLPDQIYWTVFGTINKKETAQMLVNNQNLCIDLRYEFACNYCFEADIISLWKQKPCCCGKHNETKENIMPLESLVNIWNCVMEGKGSAEVVFGMISEHNMPYAVMVHMNQAAVEYFLPKVSPEIRRILFGSFAALCRGSYYISDDYNSEYVFYVLSQMNDQERMQFIAKESVKGLQCFLTWPHEGLFMQAFYHMQSLDGTTYLLRLICEKISFRYKHYSHEHLFWQLWHIIPESEKKKFIKTVCGNEILFLLFEGESMETIKIIWKYATTKERETMITYHEYLCFREYMWIDTLSYYRHLDKKDIWQKLFPFLIKITHKERTK